MTAIVTKNPRAQLLFHRVPPARRKVEVFTELVGMLSAAGTALIEDAPFLITTFDGPAPQEIGAELITPAFTAAYSLTPTSAVLTDAEGSPSKSVIAAPTAFQSDETFSKTLPLEEVGFVLTAKAEDKGPVQATFSVPFWPRVYAGVSAPLLVGGGDEAFVEALVISAIQGTVETIFAVSIGVGERFFWAAPLLLGPPKFEVVNQPLVGAILINDAIAVTPGTPNGVPVTYQLWMGDTDDLGQVTVQVSEV